MRAFSRSRAARKGVQKGRGRTRAQPERGCVLPGWLSRIRNRRRVLSRREIQEPSGDPGRHPIDLLGPLPRKALGWLAVRSRGGGAVSEEQAAKVIGRAAPPVGPLGSRLGSNLRASIHAKGGVAVTPSETTASRPKQERYGGRCGRLLPCGGESEAASVDAPATPASSHGVSFPPPAVSNKPERPAPTQEARQ